MPTHCSLRPGGRAVSPLGILALLALLASGCVFDPSGVPPEGELDCGNGVIDDPEQCDHSDLGGLSCTDLNLGGGALSCNPDCTFNVSGCDISAICGNGTLEGGEACDDGNTADGDGCSHLCQWEVGPTCGDGELDVGEECDDGNSRNDDACLTTCRRASCGDGFVEANVEVCEPGTVPTTCVGLGYLSGDLQCLPDCLGYDLTNCLRADGQDCRAPYQCEGGECFKEDNIGYPAGYCTRPCDGSTPCPGNGQCLTVDGVGDRCFQPCDLPADCRPGYGCFDPYRLGFTVCHPHCETDADCPVTGTCNPYLGRCDVTSQGTGGYGESCDSRQDCLGLCWYDPGDGYCASRCKLSSGVCPTGGVCADVHGGTRGDEGICMKACDGMFQCRAGQSCQHEFGQDVCWFLSP